MERRVQEERKIRKMEGSTGASNSEMDLERRGEISMEKGARGDGIRDAQVALGSLRTGVRKCDHLMEKAGGRQRRHQAGN